MYRLDQLSLLHCSACSTVFVCIQNSDSVHISQRQLLAAAIGRDARLRVHAGDLFEVDELNWWTSAFL